MKDDLRPALAARQGIPVSEAEAARIAAAGAGADTALAKALSGSLFDTEPAHFERFLTRAKLKSIAS